MLNNSLRILAVALLLATSFQAAAEIKTLNKIAAEVNGNIITYGEIERAARTIAAGSDMKDIAPDQLFLAAKQLLIEHILLVDAATKQGLRVSDAQIDNEIQRRATARKTTPAVLIAEAKKLGYSDKSYRLQVAKELLIEHMQSTIQDAIKVSDSDINTYIDKAHRAGEPLPQGEPYTVYKIRRILLNINENNTIAAVGNRMNQIMAALQKNQNFGDLARRFSQEPAAANGGVLEVTEYSQPKRVENFLSTMHVNETTVPIQTSQNWQIFQLLDKRVETDPEKMQREAIRRLLLQKEQQKANQQFVSELQQNMVIREY